MDDESFLATVKQIKEVTPAEDVAELKRLYNCIKRLEQLVAKDTTSTTIASGIRSVSEEINKLIIIQERESIEERALQSEHNEKLADALDNLIGAVKAIPAAPKPLDFRKELARIEQAVNAQELNPQINVAPPDLKSVTEALSEVREAVSNIPQPVIPESEPVDLEPLEKAIDQVNRSVLKVYARPIPVPEFPSFPKTYPDETSHALLTSIRDYLDTVETKLQSLIDKPASDETKPAASTVSNLPNAITNFTILAPNTNRKHASVYNDDTTANLYLKLGVGASATSFTAIVNPGALYELPYPVYTGQIDGLSSAATGNLRITELS